MNEDGNNPEVQVDDAPSLEFSSPLVDMPAVMAELPSPEIEMTAPADDLRARLMQQFEQWLDGMLAGESAPPLPRELIEEALAETSSPDPVSPAADLYTVFAAVTKLTGEIGIQGRVFKQLNDSLAPVAQLPDAVKELEEAHHASSQEFERLVEKLDEDRSGDSSLPPSKDVLGVLFDLLERLERGLKTFEAGIDSIKASAPHGFLARMSGGERQSAQTLETVQAMHEGYRLTAARLDAAIQQWGIMRTGRVGEMFDPTSMTAIELDTASDKPAGTVVEVYRSGFMVHGQMLSTPQVKVAKGR